MIGKAKAPSGTRLCLKGHAYIPPPRPPNYPERISAVTGLRCHPVPTSRRVNRTGFASAALAVQVISPMAFRSIQDDDVLSILHERLP
jgi:hypothetical protein